MRLRRPGPHAGCVFATGSAWAREPAGNSILGAVACVCCATTFRRSRTRCPHGRYRRRRAARSNGSGLAFPSFEACPTDDADFRGLWVEPRRFLGHAELLDFCRAPRSRSPARARLSDVCNDVHGHGTHRRFSGWCTRAEDRPSLYDSIGRTVLHRSRAGISPRASEVSVRPTHGSRTRV
jgi:hypothetical protein